MLLKPLAAAALLAASAPALACSVTPGYRVPNSFQLAEAADLIVVARVEGQRAGTRSHESKVVLKPVGVLKGVPPVRPLTLDGLLERTRVAGTVLPRATRSDPAELAEPNPDALMGGCTRYIFARGMTLVLFYKRGSRTLDFMSYPFARVSEDVPSTSSRWVQAVREYVAIAKLPRAARREAMRRRAGLLARGTGDQRAIAADMRRLLVTRGALLPVR